MLGGLRSFGGYNEVLNRVLTSVDLPRPDSPILLQYRYLISFEQYPKHTDNHDVEAETFPDTSAVPLVRQVGESNVTCELSADDVLHICIGHLAG